MKVYILSEYTMTPFEGSEEVVVEVFGTPKAARQWFEKKTGIKSKGKWKKQPNCRYYQFDKHTRYYITVWTVRM